MMSFRAACLHQKTQTICSFTAIFFSSSTSVSPGLFYLTTVNVSSLSSHFFLPRPSFHLCLICSSCVIRNPSGNCFQIKETRSMTQFYSGMKLCPEIQENMKNTHLDEFSYSYTAEWTVRYDCQNNLKFTTIQEHSRDIKWKKTKNKTK